MPYSSAMTALTCVPLAIVCPCARCVEAITSSGSSAAQTPEATASWPIATCRKPGSSPARKRSSTFSSKRRISSISRNSSRRRSSESASVRARPLVPRPSPSGLIMLTAAWDSSSSGVASGRTCPTGWARGAPDLTLPRTPSSARERPRCSAPPSPGRLRRRRCASRSRAPAAAIGPDQAAKLLGKLDDERIRGTLTLVEVGERAPTRGGAARAARRAVGRGAREPARRTGATCSASSSWTRATTSRAPRCWLAPLNPARVPDRSAFRFRVAQQLRLRRLAADDARAASSALDAGGDPRRGSTILRVLSDTHNVATQGPVWRVGGQGRLEMSRGYEP